MPATGVLPDASGPKTARTRLEALDAVGDAPLEAMLHLAGEPRPLERPVLLRMGRAPLLEPRDRSRDALCKRYLRLPPEQLARLADVGDVVRPLTEQRWGDLDLRLDGELGRDQLRGAHERVPLAERQVDGLVANTLLGERVHAPCDPVDAVVDVGEVE